MSHGLRRNGKIMAKISPPPSHCREGKYTRGGFKILKWSLRCGPARPHSEKGGQEGTAGSPSTLTCDSASVASVRSLCQALLCYRSRITQPPRHCPFPEPTAEVTSDLPWTSFQIWPIGLSTKEKGGEGREDAGRKGRRKGKETQIALEKKKRRAKCAAW